MNTLIIALPLAAILTVCGSSGTSGGGSSNDIRVVGSAIVHYGGRPGQLL